MNRLSVLIACLAAILGAAGVGMAAASAHLAPGSSLSSAALIALTQAPAILAALAAGHAGLLARGGAIIGAGALLLGAILFSADIALRVFVGQPLFAMAAPIGGMVLIVGWLGLAIAGIFQLRAR